MRARGEHVKVVVTSHQSYGVLIATEDGEKGWIEAEYLSQEAVPADAWPPRGTTLDGLILDTPTTGASGYVYVQSTASLVPIGGRASRDGSNDRICRRSCARDTLSIVPEFEAEWTFSETFEADDKDAALALMRERIDKFTEPDRFRGVKRSISCRVEAVPPGEVGRQDLL